jgi:hypothetical protein
LHLVLVTLGNIPKRTYLSNSSLANTYSYGSLNTINTPPVYNSKQQNDEESADSDVEDDHAQHRNGRRVPDGLDPGNRGITNSLCPRIAIRNSPTLSKKPRTSDYEIKVRRLLYHAYGDLKAWLCTVDPYPEPQTLDVWCLEAFRRANATMFPKEEPFAYDDDIAFLVSILLSCFFFFITHTFLPDESSCYTA